MHSMYKYTFMVVSVIGFAAYLSGWTSEEDLLAHEGPDHLLRSAGRDSTLSRIILNPELFLFSQRSSLETVPLKQAALVIAYLGEAVVIGHVFVTFRPTRVPLNPQNDISAYQSLKRH